MTEKSKIFTRNHTLTDAELIKQLTDRVKQDPTSPTTLALRERVQSILETSGGENVASEESVPYNPFPPDIEVTTLPGFVQDSYITWQKLSPEKQSKISYYEKGGEWFISIDGTKISLQHESAPSNPSARINVEKGNTYFSQAAALSHAKYKGRTLPTNAHWTNMANYLGGFKELKDILQIPLNGYFHPDGNLQVFGDYAVMWSAVYRGYLFVDADGGHIDHAVDPAYGLSVRLLDN